MSTSEQLPSNFRLRRRRQIRTSIDLTALLDVVMLLIFFFLTTGTFLSNEKASIGINLPSSQLGAEQHLDQHIITVAKDESLYWNGKLVEKTQLAEIVQTNLAANPEQTFTIAGDQNARYEQIIEVMDIVKLRGAQNVNLVVQKFLPAPQ